MFPVTSFAMVTEEDKWILKYWNVISLLQGQDSTVSMETGYKKRLKSWQAKWFFSPSPSQDQFWGPPNFPT